MEINPTCRAQNVRLHSTTLKFYLHHSKEFVCDTKKESFKKIDYRTGKQENDLGTKKRTSTSALIFYLSGTGLQMEAKEDNNLKINLI